MNARPSKASKAGKASQGSKASERRTTNTDADTDAVRTDPEARSIRVRVAIALALCAAVIGAVAFFASQARSNVPVDNSPLAVAGVDSPGVDTGSCRALTNALPADIGGLEGRTLIGNPAGIAAWGNPAVILRCGVPTPQQLNCSAGLTVVNGVSWLQLSDAGQTTYLAADRAVRVALTIPDGTGTGAIQQVSDAVAASMPSRDICTDGQVNPPEGGDG